MCARAMWNRFRRWCALYNARGNEVKPSGEKTARVSRCNMAPRPEFSMMAASVTKKKPTIATVADQAGVAVSTVSRYLNGHYVSALSPRPSLGSDRDVLGYSRSWTASQPQPRPQGCIGVARSTPPKIRGSTQLLNTGIEEELTTRDTSLMLASLELRGNYDARIVGDWIRGRRIDGLIVPKSSHRERPLLTAAVENQIPTVLVAPHEIMNTVAVMRGDNLIAGRTVASHLANLGHRAIAYAGGPRHSVDSRHRLRGLREELARRGIAINPKWAGFCGSYEAEAGAALRAKAARRRLDVTAIVFGNDALWRSASCGSPSSAASACRKSSIVGFDNIPAAPWSGPA